MKKGFTLIELLITISIIALLSVIGLVIYQSFLKSTRDAKRQSDLKLIQSALEEYHADQTYYPLASNADGCSAGQFKVGCPLTNPTNTNTKTKTYMSQIPNDPTTSSSTPYRYEPSGCDSNGCKSYCLSANLENLGPSKTEGSCANPLKYNFTVTRP